MTGCALPLEEKSTQCSAAKATDYGLSPENIAWIRQAAVEQLKGCRVKGHGGVWLHTPDGVGNYGALWTRDFYYFAHYAGDLVSAQEVKASIYYLLSGQRKDGCIPDRVNAQGKPLYSPGGPNNQLADHAVDNGPFMALLVCTYVEQHGDEALFCEVENNLRRAMDQISLADNGLVYNDPENPQCVYGFTDIVMKTGHLLFTSLVYYDACNRLAALCEKTGCGNAAEYRRRAERIAGSISLLWNDEAGMFWAADRDCKQIDIWGSALAVYLCVATPSQEKRILDYLIAQRSGIMQRGQVRHLAPGVECWEKLFIHESAGRYQNGAYWATPLAWIVPVYHKRDKQIASQIMQEVVKDFQKNGINECINEDYVKVPNFVASITNVYGLVRPASSP